jgi:hypothetical protein
MTVADGIHIRSEFNSQQSECGIDAPWFRSNVFPGIDPPTCAACVLTVQQRRLDRALAVARLERQKLHALQARFR